MVQIALISRPAALCGLALLATVAAPAHAADLPLRTALPPMIDLPPPAPAPSWSGFTVGIDGGHVWSGQQTLSNVGLDEQEQYIIDVGNVGRVKMPTKSFVLRGGIGYDVQLSPGMGFVVGIAADALYTNLQRTRSAEFSTGPSDISLQARQTLDYLGTVRGRLGYAFGPVLVYGTGGFAYGGVGLKAQTNLSTYGYQGVYDGGSHGGIETGYVYGGGLEWLADGLIPGVAPGRLAFKVEYLRYDLGRRTVAISGQGPAFGPDGFAPIGHTADTTFRTEGQFVSAGLTYRFGSPGF